LTIQSQIQQIGTLNAELDMVRSNLQQAMNTCAERQRKIEQMQMTIDERDNNIQNLEGLRREDENLRKKLHNTIQELKGNIRVFCRVRPLLGAEIEENKNSSFAYEFPANNDKMIEIYGGQVFIVI
jgi:kinesin family protein C1